MNNENSSVGCSSLIIIVLILFSCHQCSLRREAEAAIDNWRETCHDYILRNTDEMCEGYCEGWVKDNLDSWCEADGSYSGSHE